MTRFWREGHGRYRNGYEHWVEGHWVDRSDWSRYSDSDFYRDHIQTRLREERVGESVTARYVNPNANCPVCGAPVFFYQNEVGSRAYFDELGPPWPKHPCTDNDPSEKYSVATNGSLDSPRMRCEKEISEITGLLNQGAISLESSFVAMYGSQPWAIAVILCKIARNKAAIIAIEGFQPERYRRLVVASPFPRSVKVGAILAVSRKKVAFVDPSSLHIRECAIRPVKNLRAFLELI
jgi:hypothetical protein